MPCNLSILGLLCRALYELNHSRLLANSIAKGATTSMQIMLMTSMDASTKACRPASHGTFSQSSTSSLCVLDDTTQTGVGTQLLAGACRAKANLVKKLKRTEAAG